MQNIWISDVKYRMAVPAIRAFGQMGATVTALEYVDTPPAASLGFYSRYAAHTLRLPREEAAFCAALRQAAAVCDEKPVLIPFGRFTLGVLARHPKLQEVLSVLTPSPTALETADNKYAVLRLGRELGVPVPFTATSEEYPSLDELSGVMPMPCVIKYRNGEALGLHAAQRYQIVHDQVAFRRVYGEMQARQHAPLAQEYVQGDGLGVSVVLDAKQCPTDFICHRRIREYPVTGGPSCCCETVFSRPLLQMACKLLAGMDFTGVAMVEFKGTLEQPVLMEVNPRFWGSSPLIYAAGSSFYESVAKTALGRAAPLDLDTCQPNYRVGQKMRFFPQDLMAFPAYFKRADHKGAVLRDCLRDALSPKIKDGLFSIADPKPFFHYLFCSRP